jgi:hypothetical protein
MDLFSGAFEGLDRFRNVIPVGMRMTSVMTPQADVAVTPEMMEQVDSFAAHTTHRHHHNHHHHHRRASTTTGTAANAVSDAENAAAANAAAATETTAAVPDSCGSEPIVIPTTPSMFAFPPPAWMLSGMNAPMPPPPQFFTQPQSFLPSPQLDNVPAPPPCVDTTRDVQQIPTASVYNTIRGNDSSSSSGSGDENEEGEEEERQAKRRDMYTGGLNHFFLQLKHLGDIQAQERMNWYTHSDQLLYSARLLQHMLDESSIKQEDTATVIETARQVAATASATSTSQERVLLAEQQRQIDLEFAMLQRLVAASAATASATHATTTTTNEADQGPPTTLRVVRTEIESPSPPPITSPSRQHKTTAYQYTLDLS